MKLHKDRYVSYNFALETEDVGDSLQNLPAGHKFPVIQTKTFFETHISRITSLDALRESQLPQLRPLKDAPTGA